MCVRHLLTGMVFIIPLLMATFAMPLHASEQSEIRNHAIELRLTIARLEQDLRHRLRDAINTAPDKVITCKSRPRPLLDCLNGPYRALMQAPVISIRPQERSAKETRSPLQDLNKTEERFAVYTDRVNKANDLLSRAGAPLFMPAQNLTPDMDNLRKRVLQHMEDRRSSSLWLEKIIVFVSGFAVLCVVFGTLYFYLRRFRG